MKFRDPKRGARKRGGRPAVPITQRGFLPLTATLDPLQRRAFHVRTLDLYQAP